MIRRACAIIFHVLPRKIWDSRLADQKQSPFEEKSFFCHQIYYREKEKNHRLVLWA